MQTSNNFNVNNSNSSELNINDSKSLNTNNSGSSDHRCPQCNRGFLSAKGVQGHQKRHNEKNNSKMLDKTYIDKRNRNTKSVWIHRQLNPTKPNAELMQDNKTLVNEASKLEAFLTNELGIPIILSFKKKILEYTQSTEQAQEPEPKPKKQKKSTLNVNNSNESQNLNLMMLSEVASLPPSGGEEIGSKTPISLIANSEKEQAGGDKESIDFRGAIQSNKSPDKKDSLTF